MQQDSLEKAPLYPVLKLHVRCAMAYLPMPKICAIEQRRDVEMLLVGLKSPDRGDLGIDTQLFPSVEEKEEESTSKGSQLAWVEKLPCRLTWPGHASHDRHRD